MKNTPAPVGLLGMDRAGRDCLLEKLVTTTFAGASWVALAFAVALSGTWY